MNQYVTGTVIRQSREAKKITQAELAEALKVSDKAVSKWETGRSYPDITLIEPLAKALGISTIELLSGESVTNRNRAYNMKKTKVYVCPICGNVIFAIGEAVISCCGIVLMPLEAETPGEHCPYPLRTEKVEDEYFVSIDHPMEKDHYITFMAAVSDDGVEIRKLYPEGPAEARFKIRRTAFIYYYCNKHGLYMKKL
ncbi:MAG: helix-turn-helix domain-containing protein [Clostridia bacterium]|nr:helix-turn-helix domain-containing protein [Clostridia bacterium]